MKPTERNTYALSTGRVVEANRGIIGISDKLEVTDGYDGDLNYPHPDQTEDVCEMDPPTLMWTQAEREELADYMIGLWATWRAKSPGYGER